MAGKTLVSIIITNYNYARYLPQAVDSALAQTYPNVEVIVVDDGSTDNSREVIADYGDRIIPVMKENGGQASAFNAGFTVSRGDIICFLDADDIFRPIKVERIVDLLEKMPFCTWVFHYINFMDEQQNPLSFSDSWDIPELPEGGLIDARQDLVRGRRLPEGRPGTTGLCFKRSLLKEILPMPEGPSRMISDEYIQIAAHYLSPGFYYPERLAARRVHRSDNILVAAESGVRTAYHLKKRFPELTPYTNKVFASAFGRLLAEWGVKRALKLFEVRQYINFFSSSITPWFIYAPRISFNFLKALIIKERQPPFKVLLK